MKIELPYIQNLSNKDEEVTYALLGSLFHRYSHNLGSTSLPYWLDRFSSQREATRITMALAQAGIIITTVPKANWAEVSINEQYMLDSYSKEALIALQKETLLDKYKPVENTPDSKLTGSCQVKLPSGIKPTGIIRSGFAKCSQYTFKYDIPMLEANYDLIIASVVKSMKSMEKKLGYSLVVEDGLDYESISKAVIEYVVNNNDNKYSLGELTNDSRGRAIYRCLQKVFNPIANKFARSLVIMPEYTVTEASLDNAYLYIAELVSGFDGDIQRKLANGKQYYAKYKLPTVDKDDDQFEVIWVKRIYAELDAYYADNSHKFTTPIELDFSASNMVIIGLLLGHSDYIDHTKYMWQIDGLSKLHVKYAQTPYVFGSSSPIANLWSKNGVEFTNSQLLVMRKEQVHGRFAVANKLKDIIIKHAQPTESIVLHSMKEHYRVECNRYTYVGDTTKQYVVYDSVAKVMKIITHTTTNKVPDLKQFKRYFMTGIIHNIDSQMMNYMVKSVSWVLPIHDAGLVGINEADAFRDSAVDYMNLIYANRNDTLLNYFKSINLDKAGYQKFAQLLKYVEKLNDGKSINITRYLLK